MNIEHERLRIASPYRRLVGVGGVGTGLFFRLLGDDTLGRTESRPGELLDVRDYCKLHIICHYVATLLGCRYIPRTFDVIPIARIGSDQSGRRLLEEMSAAGMQMQAVEVLDRFPTMLSVCFQYPDGTGGNITAENSAAATLTEEDVLQYECLLDEPSVVLAAPEVSLSSRAELLRLGSRQGALGVASFTKSEVRALHDLDLLGHIDLLALNAEEAEELAGGVLEPQSPNAFLANFQADIRSRNPRIRALVTAGEHGAFALDHSGWEHCPAIPVDVANTAGAGDALLAGVLAGLIAGLPLAHRSGESARATALELGTLLAAFSVTSPHTIHPGADLVGLRGFAARQGLDWLRFGPYIETARGPAAKPS